MKNATDLLPINKKRLPIILLILLVFVMLVQVIVSNPADDKRPEASVSDLSLEYLEDASGTMNLEEVQAQPTAAQFLPVSGSDLCIGQSRSTWWIRMKINNLSGGNHQNYLAISNPTVKRAVLYIPVIAGTGVQYETLRSGWGEYGQTQDEGFTYPVFRLPDHMVYGQFFYLQLDSPFTQNYNIRIWRDRELNAIELKDMIIVGIFYGLLLAVGIINFLNFLLLRERLYLYYVVYILLVLAHQGAFLGTYRIFIGGFSELLTASVPVLGQFMLIAALMFFRLFLNTARDFSVQDRLARILIVFCMLGISLGLLGFQYEANIFTTILACAEALLIVYTSALAVRKGVGQAKYFLAGWCAMFLGIVIFSVRLWGMIPNNEPTLFILLLSEAIEAVLLSAALVDRVRLLRTEKEYAVQHLKSAEEDLIYNESAFLQAQIKPHFLYNALNVIAVMCKVNAGKARELILDLSSYLHHSFDFGNRAKYISFDEELEFIQAYVRIEQARFGDKLKMEYELEDTEELRLPPLILQPLVENAVRHGIRKSAGGGTVVLRVKALAGCFVIEIEDDGAGMTPEQLEKIQSEGKAADHGVGLANIQQRLRMLYGTQLTIKSRVGVGTKIILTLPKERIMIDESRDR